MAQAHLGSEGLADLANNLASSGRRYAPETDVGLPSPLQRAMKFRR
jgi:hypothetical protein